MKYIYLLTLAFFLGIQIVTAQNWTQVSNTLYGSTSGDSFGKSVSLNSDGSIIAISSGGNYSATRTSVYKLMNNNWTQLGSNIFYGNNTITKLSKDGTTLIIGHSNDHNSAGNWYGSIKVYKWDGNNWVQKGNKIYGQSYGGYFGYSVGINHDGSSIVVYSIYDMNKVRAYQWSDDLSVWEQKGETISLGNSTSGITQGSIDFSADGSSFIIGNPYINNGKVAVFVWNGINWIQKGEIFNGISDEQLGTNVSINSDGSTILIGSPLNDNNGTNTGELKLYEWNDVSWIQKGQTFNGVITTDSDCCLSNFASSIDSSGDTFAYWSVLNDDPKNGVLKLYSWNTNQWVQKGASIEGGLGDNNQVNFISLNSNGNTVSIGFPYDFDFNDGINTGRVKTYNWSDTLSTDNNSLKYEVNFYPNPVKDYLNFKTELNIIKVQIYDVSGRILSSKSINENRVDLSDLKTGSYVLKLYTEKGVVNTKIIKE